MNPLKAFFEDVFMSVLVDSGLTASVDALTAQVAATVAEVAALKAAVAAGAVDPAELADLKGKVDKAVADLAGA